MIEPNSEMRLAFDEAPKADFDCYCAVCLNHRLAAVLAVAERNRPDPVEALRAAYWKLRGHASSYRSTGVFQRRQDSFRADPDNAVLARGAARDEWYARGIEAAADDLAEVLELEYDVHIEPDPSGGKS